MAIRFPSTANLAKAITRALRAPPVALDPVPGVPASGDFLLLEDGFKVLLEDNSFIVLE